MDTTNPIDVEEQKWRETIYRGDSMPEFTPRVIVVGALLGILIMSENVYMGLKTGITEAGSILSAILCFALFRTFKAKLSILENNIAQSISSAAGSIGIIVSVIPALQLVGFNMSGPQMFLWTLSIGFLGLLFAIPLRRQLIVAEKLTFPTGTACATTITAMHAHGDDAIKKAKALGIAGVLSAAVTWFRDAVPIVIPTTTVPPLSIGAYALEELSLGIYWSPLVLGVGLMIGIRVGVSLLIGAAICWGILGPWLADSHVIEKVGHSSITHWTMWPAIALMVASGFTSLALKSGTIVRSFSSMRSVSYDGHSGIEFSFRFWMGGLLVVIIALLVAMQMIFQVPLWLGMIAIALSFIFATVAIRGYGETDINPVGTMGHANQIAAGILMPGQMVTNLASGGITAGCADVSADLMQVLKTGHLLGASPRRQIYAQCIGVVVGALVSVLIFMAVTRTYGIGTETMPAPGALPWSGMAKLLSQGTSALPPYSVNAVLIGAMAGIALTLLEKTRLRNFILSPFGIGIGMVVPGFISVTIFLGSLIGMILEKKFPTWSEKYLTTIASGGIAGEAITGVIISILTVMAIIGS